MSTSEETAERSIRLAALTPATELAVVDADHRMVAHGLGRLEVSVPPGIYRIEHRCGPVSESHLVTVLEEGFVDEEIAVAMPSPAPVAGTTTASEAHQECAERASAALRGSEGDGTGLVVMVRTIEGSPLSPEGLGELALLDGVDRVVARPDWQASDDGTCLWWTEPLRPDGYVLRAPHATARELVTEQPLRISRDWQTLVFATAADGRAAVTEASIHMAPAGSGWSADDPDHVRLEAALSDLRAGRSFTEEMALDVARSGTLEANPMLAIAVGTALAAPPGAEFAAMLDELQRLLPEHPDVRILRWRLAELQAIVEQRRPEPIDTDLFDWPPMLVVAFRALQRLDALGAGAIRAGTLAERSASLLIRDGIWTAWEAEARPAAVDSGSGAFGLPDGSWNPATRRIAHHLERVAAVKVGSSREELLTRDPEQIALATGLATSTVARALTDLEAAGSSAAVEGRPAGDALAERAPATAAEVAPEPVEPPEAPPEEAPPERAPVEPSPVEPAPPERPLNPSERRLRLVSRVGAGLAGFVGILWLLALVADAASRGMAVGLLTQNLLIAFMLAIAAGDVRRFPALNSGVAGILIFSGIVSLLATLDDPGTTVRLLGPDVDERVFLILNGIVQLGFGSVMAWFSAAAQRDRFELHALSTGNRRTLSAVGDVYVPAGSPVTGDDVAGNIDRYLDRLDVRWHGRLKVALHAVAFLPVLTLHGTLSLLGSEERRTLLHRLTHRPAGRRARRGATAIGIAHELIALGYYADDRVVREILGSRLAEEERTSAAGPHPRLRVDDPTGVHDGSVVADAVVVGSGISGAVLAYRLAERGLSVIVLERGSHVQSSADRVETLSDLYREGGVHVVKNFNDRYARVMGVGGSGLLSDPEFSMVPEPVIAHWNGPEHEAGLDPQRFEEALERVKFLLPGVTMPAGELNAGARRLLDGLRALDVSVAERQDRNGRPAATAELSARSQSVVDTVLPWGQKRFGERLRLIADCRIDRILTDRGRAVGIACRLRDGQQMTMLAEHVVVAAGPVDSSKLLQASELGGRLVGRGVSATLSASVIGDFPDVLDADRGVQLGVYAGEPPDGFVVTTDWQPLPLEAMRMPGWFSEHAANMHRYRHMTSGNALVAIDRSGSVRHGTCAVSPSKEDLDRLGRRLALLGRAYLAAGARRVMPAARAEHAYDGAGAFEADLPGLLQRDVVRRLRPQGGNAISANPAKGPVDQHFRLRGTENLYVCDASLFPTAVTVAPGLTALALAEYAATEIA
jgi:hypothetical protein